MLQLHSNTDNKWLDVVLNNFTDFLLDHAACERKASASALSFVVHYPNHREIVETMIQVAQEELEHFARITQIIHSKGLQHAPDTKDSYVNQLLQLSRPKGDERLLDRLLLFSVIEGRGCERFAMIAKSLSAHTKEQSQLKELYTDLVRSESRHHMVGIQLAKNLFPEELWKPRLQELLEKEANIVASLPYRPALH